MTTKTVSTQQNSPGQVILFLTCIPPALALRVVLIDTILLWVGVDTTWKQAAAIMIVAEFFAGSYGNSEQDLLVQITLSTGAQLLHAAFIYFALWVLGWPTLTSILAA